MPTRRPGTKTTKSTPKPSTDKVRTDAPVKTTTKRTPDQRGNPS